MIIYRRNKWAPIYADLYIQEKTKDIKIWNAVAVFAVEIQVLPAVFTNISNVIKLTLRTT